MYKIRFSQYTFSRTVPIKDFHFIKFHILHWQGMKLANYFVVRAEAGIQDISQLCRFDNKRKERVCHHHPLRELIYHLPISESPIGILKRGPSGFVLKGLIKVEIETSKKQHAKIQTTLESHAWRMSTLRVTCA